MTYDRVEGQPQIVFSMVRVSTKLLALCCTGSFGRTMDDLVLLDSFMRTPNASTDELGALPAPVQCSAEVDRSMNLTGLRLGLPSNFGWVTPGLSGEVSQQLANDLIAIVWTATAFSKLSSAPPLCL